MKEQNETPSTPKLIEAQGGFLYPITDQGSLLADGATLLDYFAAHAPEGIPQWFEATLPPCPQHSCPYDLKMEAIVEAYTSENGEWSSKTRPIKMNGIFETPTKEEVSAARTYFEVREPINNAVAKWYKDKARARHDQWPYAWALSQIAERKRVIAQLKKEVTNA